MLLMETYIYQSTYFKKNYDLRYKIGTDRDVKKNNHLLL